MNKQPLIVVESSRQAEIPVCGEMLTFNYTDSPSPTGLCAWLNNDVINVSSECRSLNGLYRQQALNSELAQKVLKHRPCYILIWGVTGATADLSRVSALLGIPCHVVLYESLNEKLDLNAKTWLGDCLAKATSLSTVTEKTISGWCDYFGNKSLSSVDELESHLDISTEENINFNYSLYELCSRDHSLIIRMQEQDVKHFKQCRSVLDVGCGAGLFLQLLSEQSINAIGVERDAAIVNYARGSGLEVIAEDSLEYLRANAQKFDGMYCSHFVEHLPIEVLEELLTLMAAKLEVGGTLVLAFPDPESIRSQLLGFWRDPEHVRFYHPNLIRVMTEAKGLVCEWSSYDEQPHEVYPFASEPEPILKGERRTTSLHKRSIWQKLLNKVGVASHYDIARTSELESQLCEQGKYISQLEERTQRLWDVNKTWSWNDNVTLRFRKL